MAAHLLISAMTCTPGDRTMPCADGSVAEWHLVCSE